jgi:hypothetical protein
MLENPNPASAGRMLGRVAAPQFRPLAPKTGDSVTSAGGQHGAFVNQGPAVALN